MVEPKDLTTHGKKYAEIHEAGRKQGRWEILQNIVLIFQKHAQGQMSATRMVEILKLTPEETKALAIIYRVIKT